MAENATKILAHKKALWKNLETWKARWQVTSDFFAPSLDINEETEYAPSADFDGLFDTTGVHVVDIYANGLMTEIFPANERWAIWVHPDSDAEDESQDEFDAWYNKCSEIALKKLGQSNFYQEMKPFLKSLGYGGTGSVNVRKGKKSTLRFSFHRLGSYAAEEDDEGSVDTHFREMKLESQQIKKMFPDAKLGEKVSKDLEAYNEGKPTSKKFTVTHAIYPRLNLDKKKIDSENMPFASVYVCDEDQLILDESGYHTFPNCVARAEKWDDHTYGLAPAEKALPAMRQLNKLTRDLDAAAAVAINPRVAVGADIVDDIDWREGGVTVFDASKGEHGMPKVWGENVQYPMGIELQVAKKEEIRKFFHAGLFEAIAEKTKQMTAREVAAIESAELRSFLPNFNQLTSEIQPLMGEVFAILLEAGEFPDPPEGLIDEEGTIALPKTEFTSRISLALRMVENNAIDRLMERLIALAQIDPSVFMNVNIRDMVRLSARNDGVPESVLRSIDEIEEMEEAKREQEEAMMQAQETQVMADAAQKGAKALGDLPEGAAEEVVNQLG